MLSGAPGEKTRFFGFVPFPAAAKLGGGLENGACRQLCHGAHPADYADCHRDRFPGHHSRARPQGACHRHAGADGGRFYHGGAFHRALRRFPAPFRFLRRGASVRVFWTAPFPADAVFPQIPVRRTGEPCKRLGSGDRALFGEFHRRGLQSRVFPLESRAHVLLQLEAHGGGPRDLGRLFRAQRVCHQPSRPCRAAHGRGEEQNLRHLAADFHGAGEIPREGHGGTGVPSLGRKIRPGMEMELQGPHPEELQRRHCLRPADPAGARALLSRPSGVGGDVGGRGGRRAKSLVGGLRDGRADERRHVHSVPGGLYLVQRVSERYAAGHGAIRSHPSPRGKSSADPGRGAGGRGGKTRSRLAFRRLRGQACVLFLRRRFAGGAA